MQIQSDTDGMALALEWAAKGMYITAPNPRIGCVIVRDGVVDKLFVQDASGVTVSGAPAILLALQGRVAA